MLNLKQYVDDDGDDSIVLCKVILLSSSFFLFKSHVSPTDTYVAVRYKYPLIFYLFSLSSIHLRSILGLRFLLEREKARAWYMMCEQSVMGLSRIN